MKALTVLAAAFFCVSCGASREGAPTNDQVAVGPKSSFMDAFSLTASHPEETLLRIGSAALEAGLFLDAPRALQCWVGETSRPRVKDICILLWAAGGASEPVLENALIRGSVSDRSLAVAALMRKSSLREVSAGGLFGVLHQLRDDPGWLRSQAALVWLERNASPGRDWGVKLVEALRPAEDAGPLDLAYFGRVAFHLSPVAWHSLVSGYCDPAVEGGARLRCWRLVGALFGPDAPAELKKELAPFLPPAGDRDWKLFERNFPELALRILQHFQKGN